MDSHSFLSVLSDPAAAHERPGMAVTAGSFRQGDWKLTFNRGARSAGPAVREAGQASLYHLAEDLGETTDLSVQFPERKAQLFTAYQAYFKARKLKPLAAQVAARKQEKKKAPFKPSTAKGPPVTNAKQRMAELRRQQEGLLSEEQKRSRDASRKQALAEGKKGVALRASTDAGANLTAAQREQLDALRAEMRQLMQSHPR